MLTNIHHAWLGNPPGIIKKMKTKQDVIETRRESIKAQINGNRQHGWGQNDSLAVISDILAEHGGSFAKDAPMPESAEIREAVIGCLGKLVNPSACRQWLESGEVNLLDKVEGGKRQAKEFAEF
jgi:hypothetical protein